MATKKSVQFYLNKEQMKTTETVIQTLKNSGAVDETISEGRIAKSVFLAFLGDMTTKKKELEGE